MKGFNRDSILTFLFQIECNKCETSRKEIISDQQNKGGLKIQDHSNLNGIWLDTFSHFMNRYFYLNFSTFLNLHLSLCTFINCHLCTMAVRVPERTELMSTCSAMRL